MDLKRVFVGASCIVLTSCALQFSYSNSMVNDYVGKIKQVTSETKELRIRVGELEKNLQSNNAKVVSLSESNESLTKQVQDKDKLIKEQQSKIDEMLRQVSFCEYDVTQPSGATEYHMKKALKGTPIEVLAPCYVNAEKTYHVNALVLASISALECGWGTSSRAVNDNNLTGMGCYTDSSRGDNSSSWEESIMETARQLNKFYLTSGAKYHCGKSISDININYSRIGDYKPNYAWGEQVTQISYEIMGRANKQ